MKKRKVHNIPVFSSLAEEATFWDTHDVTDYFDEMKDVKVKFSLRTPKEESLTVRVQGPLKRKLEEVATKQGLHPSSLIRTWLVEKLGQPSRWRFPELPS